MLKKIFKKNKKEEFKYSNKEGIGTIIYENDHVNIVHDACRICYNNYKENTYEDRIKYIAGKVKVGHESILEHSNIIVKLYLTKETYPELTKVISHCRYLNIKIKESKDVVIVLIGGSIRGFKHVIRNMESFENTVFMTILNLMYELPYCYFEDMIQDEIFDRHKFKNIDRRIELEMNGEEIKTQRRYMGKKFSTEKFDIIGMDDISKVYKEFDEEEQSLFNLDDILDLVSISILFKEVSRIISQQLTRHRAGITQLSQRYVDMEGGKFLSPDMFKPEVYDKNKKYDILIEVDKKTKEGIGQFLTLQEIGDMVNTIYPQLIRQGLLKEDARAYLTNNTVTSLYMTFTFKNFIKFLELRTHKSAQAEIRLLAIELEKIFKEANIDILGEDIYAYLLPRYTRISLELDTMGEELIDEIIEEKEETVPVVEV